MQLRLLPSVAIFLGSYLPLTVILLVQDINYSIAKNGLCWKVWNKHSSCVSPFAHPLLSFTLLGICLLSFCLTLLTLAMSDPKQLITVREVKHIPAELMSYTLPYVVAFMGIGYQDIGKFAGLAIFLVWMLWITNKSGQVLVNPLLAVFGWRLYEIKYSYPGDAVLYNGRALVKGIIETGRAYPHAVIQDVLVLRPKLETEER